jgi:hypothetical protein
MDQHLRSTACSGCRPVVEFASELGAAAKYSDSLTDDQRRKAHHAAEVFDVGSGEFVGAPFDPVRNAVEDLCALTVALTPPRTLGMQPRGCVNGPFGVIVVS